MYPHRVANLVLLDAGAFRTAKSPNMSIAVRLAPYLVRVPGGRSLIRNYIAKGLREHSGSHEWLTPATERAYVEPLVDNIDRAVAMAGRMCAAREPEDVTAVMLRVRVPVRVLLGGMPHSSGPDAGDVAALDPLGALLRVDSLPGVGHFPHEETPDAVAAIVLGERRLATASLR